MASDGEKAPAGVEFGARSLAGAWEGAQRDVLDARSTRADLGIGGREMRAGKVAHLASIVKGVVEVATDKRRRQGDVERERARGGSVHSNTHPLAWFALLSHH
jgi:hypothetical protein